MYDLTAKRFNDVNAARKHLEAIRWPDGPICPHCGVVDNAHHIKGKSACSAPGSLDTSLSHAAGLIEIAACHA